MKSIVSLIVIIIITLGESYTQSNKQPILSYSTYSVEQVREFAKANSKKSYEFRKELITLVQRKLDQAMITMTIDESNIDWIFSHITNQEVWLEPGQWKNSRWLVREEKLEFFKSDSRYEGNGGVFSYTDPTTGTVCSFPVWKESCANLVDEFMIDAPQVKGYNVPQTIYATSTRVDTVYKEIYIEPQYVEQYNEPYYDQPYYEQQQFPFQVQVAFVTDFGMSNQMMSCMPTECCGGSTIINNNNTVINNNNTTTTTDGPVTNGGHDTPTGGPVTNGGHNAGGPVTNGSNATNGGHDTPTGGPVTNGSNSTNGGHSTKSTDAYRSTASADKSQVSNVADVRSKPSNVVNDERSSIRNYSEPARVSSNNNERQTSQPTSVSSERANSNVASSYQDPSPSRTSQSRTNETQQLVASNSSRSSNLHSYKAPLTGSNVNNERQSTRNANPVNGNSRSTNSYADPSRNSNVQPQQRMQQSQQRQQQPQQRMQQSQQRQQQSQPRMQQSQQRQQQSQPRMQQSQPRQQSYNTGGGQRRSR